MAPRVRECWTEVRPEPMNSINLRRSEAQTGPVFWFILFLGELKSAKSTCENLLYKPATVDPFVPEALELVQRLLRGGFFSQLYGLIFGQGCEIWIRFLFRFSCQSCTPETVAKFKVWDRYRHVMPIGPLLGTPTFCHNVQVLFGVLCSKIIHWDSPLSSSERTGYKTWVPIGTHDAAENSRRSLSALWGGSFFLLSDLGAHGSSLGPQELALIHLQGGFPRTKVFQKKKFCYGFVTVKKELFPIALSDASL